VIRQEILDYYEKGREGGRLIYGGRRLEFLRMQELIRRWLPLPPSVVLDVGGGTGAHALPLADSGYAVHLLDPVPLHIMQARDASAAAASPLASVCIGEARALPFSDCDVDAVLLLGPLYHLLAREDRLSALAEAKRVVRPGGVVIAAAISRWAMSLDGMLTGHMANAKYEELVVEDLRDGVHRNPTDHPDWFVTSYLHRPEELVAEVSDSGLVPDGPIAVEGLGWLSPEIDELLADERVRDRILRAVRRTEREFALMGVSTHFLVVGHRL
jgi:SAM-dependent methyltransferase